MFCSHNYFVYIMTNKYKNVLYEGVTNGLERVSMNMKPVNESSD